jgi:hypothetical protein
MRFSEVVKKWEDGWRGIAIDSDKYEWDFTTNYLERPDTDIDIITQIGEEWTIKEEKKEPITLVMNVTINQDSINDVKKVINELQEKLQNLKINFTF